MSPFKRVLSYQETHVRSQKAEVGSGVDVEDNDGDRGDGENTETVGKVELMS